jgi:hypothetical protein
VILPATKITDVAVVAQLDRPRLVGREHHVVNADGEQDKVPRFRSSANPLVTSSSTHSPAIDASDRTSRTLSRSRNGLIESVEDLAAYLHVLRREPASYALGLEIRVQATDEILVFSRVIDKARIDFKLFDSVVRANIRLASRAGRHHARTGRHHARTRAVAGRIVAKLECR